jgi:prophage tail gpP-like protein
MRRDGLQLRVNNQEFAGWTSASVVRSIESIAGGFSLSVSERWGGQAAPWPIRVEDVCELRLGDDTVMISGFVDARRHTIDTDTHTLTVDGRDKTGALIDCSAPAAAWECLNLSTFEFCIVIANHFGIKVAVQPGLEAQLEKVAKQSVSPGESAFEAIERACRMAAVLPVSDGAGGLLLTRVGTSRATTPLVLGGNILRSSAHVSAAARYGQYVVLGQAQGTDEFSGPSAASVKGDAIDENVRRTERLLIVRAEGAVTIATAKKRAEWEATVRAARVIGVDVTVQGWTQASGALWPINALVQIQAPALLGIDLAEMLITEATYTLSPDSGTTTTLSLALPRAFTPQPVIPPDKDRLRI